MKKTPILMLIVIGGLLIASYVISYNNHTLDINNEQPISKTNRDIYR